MTNLARFTVNGSASTNRGVDVLNAASATFQLETPTSEVWKVTFSVSDAADVNAPLASKDAPELELDNGAGSTGTAVDAATVSGSVTTTWPATGIHSYIVRCKVNNGVDPDGSVNEDYVFERMCSIRSGAGFRKIVPTEGTQYSDRGWADAQNEFVDAYAAATMPTGDTDGQFITYSSGWVTTKNLVLCNDGKRTIKIEDQSSGNGVDLVITANSGGTGDDDGTVWLDDGSDNHGVGVGGVAHGASYATVYLRGAVSIASVAGTEVIQTTYANELGFYNVTPIARQNMLSNASTADIVTFLDLIGLVNRIVA